jgi:hypothetical protein
MLGQSVNWDYQWGQIVGRAWSDDDFKRRLLADPAGALEEYDLAPPAGLRLEVLEDPERAPESTDEVLYLVLPAKPSDEDLSEEELCSVGGAVAGARCACEACGCHRCERCHCEWCGRCHHPPRPDEE